MTDYVGVGVAIGWDEGISQILWNFPSYGDRGRRDVLVGWVIAVVTSR